MSEHAATLLARGLKRISRSAQYRFKRAGLGVTAALHRGLRQTLRGMPGALDSDLLYAVYDLNAMPTSYDVLWFLAAAETERLKRGLAGIHVVVVLFNRPFIHARPPGHPDHVSEADMLWRVDNIIVPSCRLLPSCTSHSLVPSAEAAVRLLSQVEQIWPEAWILSDQSQTLTRIYNKAITGLSELRIGGPMRAPEQGREYIRNWARKVAGDRELVVITLRNHYGGPARNSDLANWIGFADSLDRTRFHPVFVPDTLQALTADPLDYRNHTLLAVAAHNMGLRLALHEEAYLNLSVSNGPAYLSVLDDVSRYLMFKILVPGLHLTSAEHLAAQGFPEGTTPAFSTPFQKWVWEDDQIIVIQREFAAMSAKIDAVQNAGVSAQ